MAQLEAEPDRRSPTTTRFTRRPVNSLQQGFLPEVNKTAFAPMRGASFRNETAEEATSDLEHATAQPTWRPPFLGAWTSRTPSNANALTALEGAAVRLGVRPSWWSPAQPLNPFGPPSPLSPLARAIKPLAHSIPWSKGGPQPAPLVDGTSPPTTMPQPEGLTSEAPLSPLARAVRPLVARGGQMQGQAVTEHAAPAAALEASLPVTQQAQQTQQTQMQQAQPQQAAVSASAVPAEPAVPAVAAGPSRGQSRGRQSTFVTDEVETVTLTLYPQLYPQP